MVAPAPSMIPHVVSNRCAAKNLSSTLAHDRRRSTTASQIDQNPEWTPRPWE